MRGYDDPIMRRVLTARLRRFTTAATAPGSEGNREAAEGDAERLADHVLALLLRESKPEDDLTAALAEYLEARAEDFRGWRP
jgi:hypothetical protein